LYKSSSPSGSVLKLAPVCLLWLCANISWASVGSCATTASLASYGAPSTADGCYATDKTFSNFSVADDSGSFGFGGYVNQTTSNVDIHTTNTFSLETTPWTVSAIFTGSMTATSNSESLSFTQANLYFLVNSTNAFLTNPTYPKPGTGLTNVITSVSLATSGVTGNSFYPSQDRIQIIQDFCAGAAPCTGTNQVGISALYGNNSSAPAYSCFAGATSGATCGSASSASPIIATFSVGITTLNSSMSYDVQADVATNQVSNTTSTINSITDIFGEDEGIVLPEPSTFLLLSFALAALAIAKLRQLR
jgi:hypothetical protein